MGSIDSPAVRTGVNSALSGDVCVRPFPRASHLTIRRPETGVVRQESAVHTCVKLVATCRDLVPRSVAETGGEADRS